VLSKTTMTEAHVLPSRSTFDRIEDGL